MRKIKVLCFLILSFVLCGWHAYIKDFDERDKAYYKILVVGSEYLEKNLGLGTFSWQLGESNNKIVIYLTLEVFQPLDRLEGRRLMVNCMKKFVEVANEEIAKNESIKRNLTNFPFNEDNLNLSFVSYVSKETMEPSLFPYFSDVNLKKDEIVYQSLIWDPKGFYAFKKDVCEKYVDAVAIVKKEQEEKGN